jgi:hypothetical protein
MFVLRRRRLPDGDGTDFKQPLTPSCALRRTPRGLVGIFV